MWRKTAVGPLSEVEWRGAADPIPAPAAPGVPPCREEPDTLVTQRRDCLLFSVYLLDSPCSLPHLPFLLYVPEVWKSAEPSLRDVLVFNLSYQPYPHPTALSTPSRGFNTSAVMASEGRGRLAGKNAVITGAAG